MAERLAQRALFTSLQLTDEISMTHAAPFNNGLPSLRRRGPPNIGTRN